jgi:hypothetical protein
VGTIGFGMVIMGGPEEGAGAGAGVGTATPLGGDIGGSIDEGSGGRVKSGGFGGASGWPGGAVPPAGVTGETGAGLFPGGRVVVPAPAEDGSVVGALTGAGAGVGWAWVSPMVEAGLRGMGTTAAGGMGAAGAGDGVAIVGAGSRVTLGAVRGITAGAPPVAASGIGYAWARGSGTS